MLKSFKFLIVPYDDNHTDTYLSFKQQLFHLRN